MGYKYTNKLKYKYIKSQYGSINIIVTASTSIVHSNPLLQVSSRWKKKNPLSQQYCFTVVLKYVVFVLSA